MSGGVLARTRNGQAIERDSVPRLAATDFRRSVLDAVGDGARVAALFGMACDAGVGVELVVALADDDRNELRLATTVLDQCEYDSLTPECTQVHLFEREIAEQWRVTPLGHPWLKPVRFAGSRRSGLNPEQGPAIGDMSYFRVEGEEVHEVAVGPVHAGVIEPGHFRFQCDGEHVFHLEISLGYQHRGVERALVGGPDKRTVHRIETIAGDTTAGHVLAYCRLVEGLQGSRVSARAHALRGVALELERLANHTGGLGALANDVAFLPTASFCGRLRGEFLQLTAALCGSRFGRGLIRPGGVLFDVDAARSAALVERLDAACHDVGASVDLLWESASVQARFESTGALSTADAKALGLVGVAARACGIERDVRQDHPDGVFRVAHIPVSVWQTGDVFARAYVRWLEIQRSAAFIRDQLAALPGGPTLQASPPIEPNRLCVSLVEGWRGEICHVGCTDEWGRFSTYKVVDPSFHNWPALALSMRGQPISDFPLCNKSFDLSYCGFDL